MIITHCPPLREEVVLALCLELCLTIRYMYVHRMLTHDARAEVFGTWIVFQETAEDD